MFALDEPTAEAIRRRAYEEGGELSDIVEFKRHFPLISDHEKARECARIIAGWKPPPAAPPKPIRGRRTRRRPISLGLGRKPVPGLFTGPGNSPWPGAPARLLHPPQAER